MIDPHFTADWPSCPVSKAVFIASGLFGKFAEPIKALSAPEFDRVVKGRR